MKISHTASVVLNADMHFGDFQEAITNITGVPRDARVVLSHTPGWSDQRENYSEPAKVTVTFSWET